ncbi:restriction endonuclease subunit S [Bacillus swezeyi]|uniref:restriction endonuclease subunit S n=1 Tax=Bacillus swezeyi TaxID=1925020 RepID=UPI0039C6BFDD
MENNNTPEIRFPGYSGDWEERKIGEFLTESRISGTNGLKAKKLTVKLWGKGVVPKEEIYQGSEETKYYIRKAGQFIYGKLDFLHQAFGLIPDNLDGYESTLDSPAFDIAENLNSFFFLEYVSRKQFYLYQGTIANGSRKAKRIHSDTFFNMPLIMPSVEEQTDIGTFFKKIDDTIALHQQELTTLKQTKQGFLQKMFPKEGESVPEVRFPGFTEDWEERKLGDLSEIRRGASPRPIQDPKWFDDESDVGWLRISDVTEQNGLIHHVEQHISEEGQKKTLVLNEPHLILSIAATVGKPVINYIKTGVHDGFIVFINPNFNIDFMFQWLEKFRPKWKKYGQPGSQVNINSELVREQDVFLPSLEEQEKISEFFKRFDDTIALHQRELDALKETKKAFLQKMFV